MSQPTIVSYSCCVTSRSATAFLFTVSGAAAREHLKGEGTAHRQEASISHWTGLHSLNGDSFHPHIRGARVSHRPSSLRRAPVPALP